MTNEQTDLNTCAYGKNKQRKPEGLTKEFREFTSSILDHFLYFTADLFKRLYRQTVSIIDQFIFFFFYFCI